MPIENSLSCLVKEMQQDSYRTPDRNWLLPFMLFKNARMSFQQPLVLDPFGDLPHRFVVIEPVKASKAIRLQEAYASGIAVAGEFRRESE
jgi:hypothetical protein